MTGPYTLFWRDCTQLFRSRSENISHKGKKGIYVAQVILLSGLGSVALYKGLMAEARTTGEVFFKRLFVISLSIGYTDCLRLIYRDRLYAPDFYARWRNLQSLKKCTVERSVALAELIPSLFFDADEEQEQNLQRINESRDSLEKIKAGEALYKHVFSHSPQFPSERMEGIVSRFLYQDLLMSSHFHNFPSSIELIKQDLRNLSALTRQQSSFLARSVVLVISACFGTKTLCSWIVASRSTMELTFTLFVGVGALGCLHDGFRVNANVRAEASNRYQGTLFFFWKER